MTRVGLSILFALGMLVGLLLAIPIFFISVGRKARTVHARGVVCAAEVTPLDDAIGPRLAGPALVRLSGAFEDEDSPAKDVLGLEVRLRKAGDPDRALDVGDQDVLFGTFESFATASADKRRVDQHDYLNNQYASVTPWLVPERGIAHLRLLPPAAADAGRGATRTARLDADLAAGRATMTLEVRRGDAHTPVARIALVERLPVDGADLRVSMFRTGRGLVPTGFRNGIRAIVYPASQAGRRLRGG